MLKEHLPYELNMLEQALLAWSRHEHMEDESPEYWFARMSAIEAFWTQARNIREFFTLSGDEGRTARAKDFTVKPMDYDFEELGNNINRLHAQISHLNYDRPAGEAPGEMPGKKLDYDFARRVKDAVDRAVAQFQQNLTPAAIQHWEIRTPTAIPHPPGAPPGPSSHFEMTRLSINKDRR